MKLLTAAACVCKKRFLVVHMIVLVRRAAFGGGKAGSFTKTGSFRAAV